MNIVEFLKARMGEDEAVARAASAGPWTMRHGSDGTTEIMSSEPLPDLPGHFQTVTDDEGGAIPPFDGDAAHIAHFDPARTLREVAAKRAILDYCEKSRWARKQTGEGDAYHVGETDAYETVVHQLAAVYAGHPEFDPSWRV
jgi:hypothetical protein